MAIEHDLSNPADVLSTMADLMENPESGRFSKQDRIATVQMIRDRIPRINEGEQVLRALERLEAKFNPDLQ